MAISRQQIFSFPPPDEEQAVALQIVSDYLSLAGTQTATLLLGCPKLDGDISVLAEFSNNMLRGAALCAGLVRIADYLGDA